jgi:hypothetical protein
MTPLAAWKEGISQRKNPLRHRSDEREFFLDFPFIGIRQRVPLN